MLFNTISRIIRKKELLSIDYVPKTIVGREKEIKDLAFHLSYIFRENPSLPQLLIFGGTGTGKTTIILYILKELEKEVKNRGIKLRIVKIKGSENRTKYEILKKILMQIAPDIPISSASADLHNKIINVIAERGIY
ncbi:MAG: AAA family ATPase, partial [Promethearchaeota archaeon]